jgi:hypothetical protein
LPHTATVETAGAHRRSSAMPTAMRSRQSARGLGLGLGAGKRKGGSARLGRAGSTKPTRVGLTSGPRLSVFFLNN